MMGTTHGNYKDTSLTPQGASLFQNSITRFQGSQPHRELTHAVTYAHGARTHTLA